jgi:hypothetical protein
LVRELVVAAVALLDVEPELVGVAAVDEVVGAALDVEPELVGVAAVDVE